MLTYAGPGYHPAIMPATAHLVLLWLLLAAPPEPLTATIDLPELAAPGAHPETGRYTRIRVRAPSGTMAGVMVTVRTTSWFSEHLETLGTTDGEGTIGWTPRGPGRATIFAQGEILEDPEGRRIQRLLRGELEIHVNRGHEDRQALLHIAIAAIAVLVIGLGAYLARRMFRSST